MKSNQTSIVSKQDNSGGSMKIKLPAGKGK